MLYFIYFLPFMVNKDYQKVLRTYYATAADAATALAAALRKQIETIYMFPQRRRQTRPIRAEIMLNQWLISYHIVDLKRQASAKSQDAFGISW